MTRLPSRFWAFVLTVCAATALALPIVYAVHIYRTLSPFGTLVVWTTVCVAIFAILTVCVSVVRAFVRPAVQTQLRRRRNGNL